MLMLLYFCKKFNSIICLLFYVSYYYYIVFNPNMALKNNVKCLILSYVKCLCVCLCMQVKALLSEGINRPRKGADAGDHPPITPMRAASESELGMTVRLHIFTFNVFHV